MKRRPIPLETKGSGEFPYRIEAERTSDGEHQKVKLFVRVDDGDTFAEVPLPVIPAWIHEALDERFAEECAA